MECINYVVPVQIEDSCYGCRTDIKCVYSTDAYTQLGISANASLDVILNAFLTSLVAQNNLINAQASVIEDLEERIEILES